MNIDENYRILRFVISKNQNGSLKPTDFNLLINSASVEYQSFLLGEVEQFQYNNPKARVELGNNEILLSKLSPFIDTPTDLTIDGTGKVNYPTGYLQRVALYTSTLGKIRWAEQDRLTAYLTDPIDPIASNPIYLLESTGFQFYPITLGTAKVSFVRKPVDAVWAFTSGVNGRPVYDATNSVNLEWKANDQIEVLARVLRKLGVNLQAQQVSQYANEIKLQGA